MKTVQSRSEDRRAIHNTRFHIDIISTSITIVYLQLFFIQWQERKLYFGYSVVRSNSYRIWGLLPLCMLKTHVDGLLNLYKRTQILKIYLLFFSLRCCDNIARTFLLKNLFHSYHTDSKFETNNVDIPHPHAHLYTGAYTYTKWLSIYFSLF